MRRGAIITLKAEREGFKRHLEQGLCKIYKIPFLFTSLWREGVAERKRERDVIIGAVAEDKLESNQKMFYVSNLKLLEL